MSWECRRSFGMASCGPLWLLASVAACGAHKRAPQSAVIPDVSVSRAGQTARSTGVPAAPAVWGYKIVLASSGEEVGIVHSTADVANERLKTEPPFIDKELAVLGAPLFEPPAETVWSVSRRRSGVLLSPLGRPFLALNCVDLEMADDASGSVVRVRDGAFAWTGAARLRPLVAGEKNPGCVARVMHRDEPGEVPAEYLQVEAGTASWRPSATFWARDDGARSVCIAHQWVGNTAFAGASATVRTQVVVLYPFEDASGAYRRENKTTFHWEQFPPSSVVSTKETRLGPPKKNTRPTIHRGLTQSMAVLQFQPVRVLSDRVDYIADDVIAPYRRMVFGRNREPLIAYHPADVSTWYLNEAACLNAGLATGPGAREPSTK